MKRTSWREHILTFPFWELFFPWNCTLGFVLFMVLFGGIFEALGVQYGYTRAIGLAFGILAVRQIRLNRKLAAPSCRKNRLACLLLACGYLILSFITLVDAERLGVPGWLCLPLLIGGILCCLSGLVVGFGTGTSACCIPGLKQKD